MYEVDENDMFRFTCTECGQVFFSINKPESIPTLCPDCIDKLLQEE